jgi:Pentapeptide repeats (8 copies)
MRWLKRGMWKAFIVILALMLFLVFVGWAPFSVSAYRGKLGLATPVTGTVQATPTIDATMTALNKEKLQHENDWWWSNGATILTSVLSTLALLAAGIFAVVRYFNDRRDAREQQGAEAKRLAEDRKTAQDKELKDREEARRKDAEAQDKELRAQAEERFKTAVTALGSENEANQVNGAILLRSFLNKEDEKIYGRYYTQIFDLAVAYLRPSNISRLPEDLDGLPLPPEEPSAPLPLTPLRKALIAVFKEAFPLARKRLGLREPGLKNQALDASHIQLDNVFLVASELSYSWMEYASLSKSVLIGANLGGARLFRANLKKAYLFDSNLREAMLIGANLSEAWLEGANLEQADLAAADLSRVRNIEKARSLKDTNLRKVKGLTKEQLEACKARGAIIDEDTTIDSSQPDPTLSQVNTPSPSTDGSSSNSSQQGPRS